jgi:hypothetical protein
VKRYGDARDVVTIDAVSHDDGATWVLVFGDMFAREAAAKELGIRDFGDNDKADKTLDLETAEAVVMAVLESTKANNVRKRVYQPLQRA